MTKNIRNREVVMKSFWYNKAGLFTCPYRFTLCLNEKQFHMELKKANLPISEWCRFMTNKDATAESHIFEEFETIIVCMRYKKNLDNIQIACLLVHEAVHIWRHTCMKLGESSPAIEQEAYGIQRLSQHLMDLYVCRHKNSSNWLNKLIKDKT